MKRAMIRTSVWLNMAFQWQTKKKKNDVTDEKNKFLKHKMI